MFALLAAVSVAALGVYSYTARAASDRDQFIYAQVGKEIVAGHRLYGEMWIDKPPLGMFMYALPQLIVPRSYRAIVIFDALLIIAQAFLLAYAFHARTAAALAAGIFLVLYPLDNGTCLWPSTEHFANVFITGILLLALGISRRRSFALWQCFAAGMLAMAAFHVRQNMVLCGILPLLSVCLAQRTLRDRLVAVVTMAAGGLAMWGVVLGLVAAAGDLNGYFFSLFEYPRLFAGAGSTTEAIDLAKNFFSGRLALFALVYGLLAITGEQRVLAAAALVVGLGACLLPMHNHPHYLANSIPYVALLIGLGTERMAAVGPNFPWLSVAAVCVSLLPVAVGRVQLTSRYSNYDALAAVAAESDRLAPPDATLLVVGPLPSEAIQFASRLPAAHKHCWSFQYQDPWKAMLPTPWDSIHEDLLARPPGVLVVKEESFQDATAEHAPAEMIESLVLVRELMGREHYEQAGSVNGFLILLRKPVVDGER